MTDVVGRAMKAAPPSIAEQYESDKVRLLISVCRELQKEAGDQPFFLSTRSVAETCGISPMEASRWLRGLVGDGVLKLVARGSAKERKASEFRYTPGD